MNTVFFDVDTQNDFMYPSGALYVPGAEQIIQTVAELNRRAPVVISTMCAHAEDDPEFAIYGHHCVAGTIGQQKPALTLIGNPERQILLEKRKLDCFSNPALPALLDRLHADRYIVYGVVTEICVQMAAFGLLKTGKRVEIVGEATKALDAEKAGAILAELSAAGARVISGSEALAH